MQTFGDRDDENETRGIAEELKGLSIALYG
jgi:hypothetical protein